MSEHDDERPVEPPASEPVLEAPADSMMEQLRKQHAELLDSNTTDMPIPGYNGMLVARYRVLQVKEEIAPITRKVMHEVRDPQEQQYWITVDTLMEACVEMFYNDGTGKLRPLAESIGPDEPPVRYDNRLAEFLGVKAESARDAFEQVFGGNEPMIMAHGREMSVWMTTLEKDAMAAFMRGM